MLVINGGLIAHLARQACLEALEMVKNGDKYADTGYQSSFLSGGKSNGTYAAVIKRKSLMH
jgi:butyrate kinase